MMGVIGDLAIGIHVAMACGFFGGVLSCWGYAVRTRAEPREGPHARADP